MSTPDQLDPRGEVRRELLDILQRLEAAENAGDHAYFVSMMTDDVVLIVPDFPMQEGKLAASAFVRDLSKWQGEHLDRHITYRSVEIVVEGVLAFDRGTFSFSIAEKGRAERETVTGKYLWVYRRQQQSWRIWRAVVARDEEVLT